METIHKPSVNKPLEAQDEGGASQNSFQKRKPFKL